MVKKFIYIIISVVLSMMFIIPSAVAQTGTTTTNGYFYLPAYGEFGEEAFDEYNLYMEKADNQIEANKEDIESLQTAGFLTGITGESIGDLSDVDLTGIAGNKILKYNATSQKLVVADDEDTTYSAGTGLSLIGTEFSSTITQYTDNLAISAIKNDNDWNASNWDTAYGWGNHSSAGYLKGITNENIESLKNVSITSATSGQVLKYNGTNWVNDTDANTIYTAGTGIDITSEVISCTVTDTDTTYTAGDGLKLTGTQFSLDFKYDPSLSSGEYSGIPDTGIVGENVVFGDLLYFKWSDKKYYKAKADDPETAEVVAMAVEAKSANQSCTIIRQGYVCSNFMFGFSNSVIYLSTAAAGRTQSSVPNNSGDQIKRVGQAVGINTIFFNPSQDIGEVK